MDSKAEQKKFKHWTILHIFESLIALLISRPEGIGVKNLLFAAMTISFPTATLFAWIAMDTIK